MQKLIISQFKDKNNNNELTTTQTIGEGITKICVKTSVKSRAQAGWSGGKSRTLVGWIKILPEDLEQIQEHLEEGADYNEICQTIGWDPLQLYTQLSFQAFWDTQECAKKKHNGALVDALLDGKKYYAQTAFAYADEAVDARVWGRCHKNGKKTVFTADPSVRKTASKSAPAEQTATESAEGSF